MKARAVLLRASMSRLLICITALAAFSGCGDWLNGAANLSVKGDPSSAGADSDGLRCDAPTPGPAPMRRLSHIEYRYAIEDLFGNAALASEVSDMLVADPVSLGFSNSALLLDVKPVLGQQYMDAAEKIAETVTANLPALLPCDLAHTSELTCATQFVRALGHRAYRRPLTDEEEARYLSGYQSLRAQYDFKTGIEWIVSTMLQSPSFLYRPEPNDGAEGPLRPVRPLELASRLSFLIWHSIPDDALLAAAEEGRLHTPQDVEREARRMLADSRAQRFLNFFEEWLDVNKLGKYTRDPNVFGALDAELPALFREETRTFVKHVVFDEGGRFETLITAPYTYANDKLAAHYGLAAVSGSGFVKVALPPGRRGVWMQGGPLTAHDKATRTSIVLRGLRVRTALLCQNIPAPPNNVNLNLGPIDPTASQADRLAAHRQNPSCAGCHGLLDPVGQLFENVDAVGRLRSVDEGGHAVVTSGQISSTKDIDGAFSSGEEFLSRVATSEQVRRCFATQLFRYVHGREVQDTDACSQKQAWERFAASGFDIRELVIGEVLSDDFLYRPVEN